MSLSEFLQHSKGTELACHCAFSCASLRFIIIADDAFMACDFLFTIDLSSEPHGHPSRASPERYKRIVISQSQRQLHKVRIVSSHPFTWHHQIINRPSSSDEGLHYSIPGTALTIHLTLLPTKIPLSAENTLLCLHTLAKDLALEPQSKYLDHLRTQTTYDVEAIISPVKCAVCGITYGESTKVLAGLWYCTSRKRLLYVQRYGVFESRTGTMVAWGRLSTAPPAPGLLEGMDMVSTLSLGATETS